MRMLHWLENDFVKFFGKTDYAAENQEVVTCMAYVVNWSFG